MRKDHVAAAAAIALIGLAVAIPISIAQDNPPPVRSDQPDGSAPTNPSDVSPAVPILESHELQGILGKEVHSATDENMGRIVDVVVDRSGQVRRSSTSAVFSVSAAARSPWTGTP